MANTLQENLLAATNAVRVVDSNMMTFGGAANKPDETKKNIWNADPRSKNIMNYANPGTMLLMNYEMEQKFKTVLAEQERRLGEVRANFERTHPGGSEPWTRQKLMDLAKFAREKKVGQCTEQVAIAFEALIDKGMAPLDFMIQEPRRLDHVFLVIGRTKSTKREWDIDKPPPWGSLAVVCDPWSSDKANRAYPATKLPEMMKLPYAVSTLFRLD
jgi:hypothetical protein